AAANYVVSRSLASTPPAPHHSTQRAHTSSTRPVIIIAITPVTCLQPSAQTNSPSTQSGSKRRDTAATPRTATAQSQMAAAQQRQRTHTMRQLKPVNGQKHTTPRSKQTENTQNN
ncbi:hypothetical protein TcCL_ESM09492, partial [Trypanosoma cruzi]